MNVSYPRNKLTVAPAGGRSAPPADLAVPMQEIAAKVFAGGSERTLRHIMVTGVTRKVGTSFIARGLAESLSAGGQAVLIIELSADRTDGMTLPRLLAEPDMASSEQPLTLQLGLAEVTALVAPGSSMFEQVSRGLQERFDSVVWDLPPPGQRAPTAVASRLMDGTILVAENDRTTRRALTFATARLRAQEARLLGVVLNRIRRRVPRWLDRLA